MPAPRTRSRDHITHEVFVSIYDYNEQTGVFTYKVRRAAMHPGDRAGCTVAGGYRAINVLGCLILEHILAWFYMTGEWPDHLVDHRNRVRSDNYWENLRPTDYSYNRFNSSVFGPNRGVWKVVRKDGSVVWRVATTVRGVRTYHGSYINLEEARAVYAAKAKELHGEFFCCP